MPDFAPLVSDYLKDLSKAANAPGATPEISLRTPLENLFTAAVKSLGRENDFHLANEATTAGVKGRPDFILHYKKSPVGYIEAESIDANIRKLTGSAKVQNDHYSKNLDNFILTNHLDFELWHEGKIISKASLPDPRSGFSLPMEREIHDLTHLLDRFFGSPAVTLPSLKDPKDLAQALARRTRQLNNAVTFALENNADTYLKKLKTSFEAELLPNLSDPEFADLYAQTVAYGLFAARCAIQNDASKEKSFDRLHAQEFIPKSNPFLGELFQQITSRNLDADIRWITDDIANLLRAAPVVSVRSHGSSLTKREDPVIHFYETFLAAYDPKLREQRGVYYTPEPVVSYIIRSVDEILKSSFGKKDGLADDSVKILDPATGTGTFLAQTISFIYDSFKAKGDEGMFSPDYVAKKLVPRLFGFELMVAPYTIAHLKIHLLLKDLCPGYDPKRRLEVYLTNTLEPPQVHPELAFAEYISKENNSAAQIKANEDILVIIGNPPYSGHSANASKYDRDRPDLLKKKGDLTPIGQLLHGQPILMGDKKLGIAADNPKQPNYFACDGKPLGERNPKWLNDDYVKFIRFSQWRIDRTGEGVLGFITNHGFLDNPTFRGMRQALMQSFSAIHILDLHGNDRKKETDPDTGEKDENVFDIQQGVAIILALKLRNHTGDCKVFHKDLFGKRLVRDSNKRDSRIVGGKYGWLWENSLASSDFKENTAEVVSPYYLYGGIPDAMDKKEDSVDLIFPTNGWGVATRKDYFLVDFDEGKLARKFDHIATLTANEAISIYKIKVSNHWDFSAAHETICSPTSRLIKKVEFRPWDQRFVYYSVPMIERGDHRFGLMSHSLRPNLNLLTIRRQETGNEFNHVWISDSLSVLHTVAAKEGNFHFPLYLYPVSSKKISEEDTFEYRTPNFSEDFLKKLAAALGTKRHFIEGYTTELTEMLGKDEAPPLPFEAACGLEKQYHGLPKGVSPEDIFHYIYAVLHSPAYRERYKDFLKIDFPRIPLPKGRALFDALVPLGRKLTALHLLDAAAAPELEESRHPFPNSGDSTVHENFGKKTFPGFENGIVRINMEQHFGNVSPEVWTHTIGGYQPAEKWLKDRRGRTLTNDDLRHYRRMLIAIAETHATMPEIDKAIAAHGDFPAAFS